MKTTRFYLAVCAAMCVLLACSSNNNGKEQVKLIDGGKTYGGKLRFMSEEPVQNFFPSAVNDKYSQRITTQIFESLLKLDGVSLDIKPALAERFEINGDGTVYTFHIRKGVSFHKDECFKEGTRHLVAEDVKFALDYLCSGSHLVLPDFNFIDLVKGAKSYYESKGKNKSGVEGIQVKDNAVVITLNQPYIGFEAIVTKNNLSIFPQEALAKYGDKIVHHPVGTGPFQLSVFDDKKLLLVRNDNYWKSDAFGNKLPYLSEIEVIHNRDKKTELMAFRNRDIDLVLDVGAGQVDDILGTLQEAKEGKNVKHRVESSTVLGIDFIGFNQSIAPFNDLNVRKAFTLAIDPEALIVQVLNGDGVVPDNGYVPYMVEFDNKSALTSVDVNLAQQLLVKAGYSVRKPFPELTLYVNGDKGSLNYAIAEGVKNQLKKNLGISLALKSVSFLERNEAIKAGEAKIWKAGVVADIPSPIDFLFPFYTDASNTNAFRFSYPAFNEVVRQAIGEKEMNLRNGFIRNAQDYLKESYTVIPLLRDDMIVIVNVRARDVQAGQTEVIDFSEVFIKELRD